ncbi:MAG: hypothetical protein V2B18_23870 [Pseudomonadota bacterium]
MSKKYNLSVPDDLAEKIELRRDRLGSLSAIFRDAVAGEIGKREQFERRLKGDEDMEHIIERLSREKASLTTDYRDKGLEAGLRWAKAASYGDLEYARRFDPRDDEGVYDPTITLHDDVLGHYFIDALEADPLTNPEADEDRLNEYALQWLRGWMEAVAGFWAEVKDRL